MNPFRALRVFCGLVLVVFAAPTAAINAVNHDAYAANIGWLNARADGTNGALIGQLYCTGFVWSANCGWIALGNGPTNGWKYSNTAEYLAGTDPLNATDFLRITALARTATTNAVSWPVVPTRLYRLEHATAATNNANWTDAGSGLLNFPAPATATAFVPDPATTTRYYRATAILPLAP